MELPASISHWLNHERLRRVKGVLVLAGQDFMRDQGPSWAAAIAYYSLLSLFPLLLALGSIASFFVDRAWAVQQATGYLGDLLPRGSAAIQKIVQQTLADGRGAALWSVVPLLWSGTLVFNAIAKALNMAFEAEERYSFWKRMGIRAVMLLTLGVMFGAALACSVLLQVLRASLGVLPFGRELLLGVIMTVLPAAFMLLAFALSYRYIPRRRPSWKAALFGAAIAAVLFMIAKPLFLGYIRHLGRYSVIYGSLAGIIIVVLWTWVVAMIGLYGGQVASHTQMVFLEGQRLRQVRDRRLDEAEADRRERIRRA